MDKKDTIHEFTALKRLLDDSINFNIIVLGAFYKDILIGFSISELLHDKYAIMHFTKANVDYHGIYQLLYKETAKIHFKRGAIYLNREQDLGIESLRSAKLSWNPVTFLKKYIISEK